MAIRIQAGKLRHRIEIMALTGTQDSFGGTVIDQATVFATVPAAIEALSGRELEAAQQIVAEVTHRVTMRWMPGIRARQNIRWTIEGGAEYDRFFQIQAVQNPDEISHKLMLLCIERDDSGLDVES